MIKGDREFLSSVGCSRDNVDSVRVFANEVLEELDVCSASSSDESDMEDPVSEKPEGLMSECASVYLVLTISSTRGVRKDTFLSAGKRGRIDILRRFVLG